MHRDAKRIAFFTIMAAAGRRETFIGRDTAQSRYVKRQLAVTPFENWVVSVEENEHVETRGNTRFSERR